MKMKKDKYNQRIISIVIALALVLGLLYFVIVHQIIRAAYYEKAGAFLNNFFQGRNENSLEYYLRKSDFLYLTGNLIIICFILGFSSWLKFWKHRRANLYLFKKDLKLLKSFIYKNKPTIYISLLLFVIFYCIYFSLGNAFLVNYDILEYFGADHWKPSWGWTISRNSGFHEGVHPLLLLMVKPLGILLSTVISPRPKAVLFLNSFFGAFAVVLSFLFFLRLLERYLTALLLTGIFGFSMSQLVFASIPESYALAACSIITTYILLLISLKTRRILFLGWVLIGIFSLGVTITNFSQSVIGFSVVLISLNKREKFIRILEYIGSVITVAFFLNILQKLLFSGAYFFLPKTVTEQVEHAQPLILQQPLIVLEEICKNFLLVNFVSPYPAIVNSLDNPGRLLLTFFREPLNYNLIGWITVIIWLIFWMSGVYKNIRSFLDKNKNPLIISTSIGLLCNIFLHSIYGVKEMFLYTCNFTFLVLVLGTNLLLLRKLSFQILTLILVALMAINNLNIMQWIASLGNQ